jgi:alpha-mannosidase
LIDNFVIGHQWLKKEFGFTPNIAWQLDAFGHSSAMTRIFADLGMEALFMSRGDMEYKQQKAKNKML